MKTPLKTPWSHLLLMRRHLPRGTASKAPERRRRSIEDDERTMDDKDDDVDDDQDVADQDKTVTGAKTVELKSSTTSSERNHHHSDGSLQ